MFVIFYCSLPLYLKSSRSGVTVKIFILFKVEVFRYDTIFEQVISKKVIVLVLMQYAFCLQRKDAYLYIKGG